MKRTATVIAVCLSTSLATPSEYWALTTAAVRRARASRGQAAADMARRGRALLSQGGTSSNSSNDPLKCGSGEHYNGAAGPMWYANPFTAGCSRASMDLTYVHNGEVLTAKKGDLIKMHCDNWQCPIPPVVDCYRQRDACAADEWCMVITHEKWGGWAMGKNGHTPNFEYCGESHANQMQAIASKGNLDKATLTALKNTRDSICGSSVVGVANGIKLTDGYSEDAVWKPSHGRCAKCRQEGQSCIPTRPTHGRFANAFVRRDQTSPAPASRYPNGGTMERPLACAPGLVCTGGEFDVLPSTCVKERPADVCYAGPWWDSSRCPRTAKGRLASGLSREWAL
eukprot:TRINITY_DN4104_c0_g1_i1.p1 TRINITY_DN4104_c0_g1~~TRINITY_DN4104_c0_g1_i1.p1  ORF type:complete len:340 (+),score=19.30 TRINITY_DN4104_c0_g1_i1:112-1131(+)